MAKIKTFPKTISVKIDNDGDDDYLNAHTDPNGLTLADQDEKVRVGIYRLDHVREVVMETKSTPVGK